MSQSLQEMNGLVREAGKFRLGNAGIFDSAGVVHIVPPAFFVPEVIRDSLREF